MVQMCLICRSAIWQTEGGLCQEHQGFALLWALVAAGAWTDFPDGRYSHREMQRRARRAERPVTPWQLVVGDINRVARYWLDGRDGDAEQVA